MEAEAFPGPAVVLAYLPSVEDVDVQQGDTVALEQLKETKKAVDVGQWPLYRWNPNVCAHLFAPLLPADSNLCFRHTHDDCSLLFCMIGEP